ncbi:MAG: sensor histidine kinase [Ferrimicrobium sp.]
MRYRLRGLVPRLVLVNAAVAFAVIFTALVLVLRLATATVTSQNTRALEGAAHAFAGLLVQNPTVASLTQAAHSYLATGAIGAGESVVIRVVGGTTLLSSSSVTGLLRIERVRNALAHPTSVGQVFQSEIGKVHELVLVEPIVRHGATVALYVVGESLYYANSQLGLLSHLVIALGIVAFVFEVVAASLLLRRIVRSVDTVTATAVEIAHGDLSRRLETSGRGDELDRLVEAFNAMIAKLASTMSSQRALLGDVSHQLRTPLTVMRGNLELLEREVERVHSGIGVEEMMALEGEIAYMSNLVDRLVYLERVSQHGVERPELVDVRALVSDCFASSQVTADRDWRLDAVVDAVILVDAASLRGAILNLLDNARKVTSSGTVIALGANRREDGELVIVVRDEGPGIDAAAQQEIFERFRRASSGGRGAGLGLAIVKAVVEAHGGYVELASELGQGSRFSIVLPSVLEVTLLEQGSNDDTNCDS